MSLSVRPSAQERACWARLGVDGVEVLSQKITRTINCARTTIVEYIISVPNIHINQSLLTFTTHLIVSQIEKV